MNQWAATHLLVPKTVCRTIELHDVETLRLRAARIARDGNAIALLEGLAVHADVDQLRAIVHFELPLLCASAPIFDFLHQKRMGIDELKLRDHAFNGHLTAAVVYARNRMMCMGRQDRYADPSNE